MARLKDVLRPSRSSLRPDRKLCGSNQEYKVDPKATKECGVLTKIMQSVFHAEIREPLPAPSARSASDLQSPLSSIKPDQQISASPGKPGMGLLGTSRSDSDDVLQRAVSEDTIGSSREPRQASLQEFVSFGRQVSGIARGRQESLTQAVDAMQEDVFICGDGETRYAFAWISEQQLGGFKDHETKNQVGKLLGLLDFGRAVEEFEAGQMLDRPLGCLQEEQASEAEKSPKVQASRSGSRKNSWSPSKTAL